MDYDNDSDSYDRSDLYEDDAETWERNALAEDERLDREAAEDLAAGDDECGCCGGDLDGPRPTTCRSCGAQCFEHSASDNLPDWPELTHSKHERLRGDCSLCADLRGRLGVTP